MLRFENRTQLSSGPVPDENSPKQEPLDTFLLACSCWIFSK